MKIQLDSKILLGALDLIANAFTSNTLSKIKLTSKDKICTCSLEIWDSEAVARVQTQTDNDKEFDLEIFAPTKSLEIFMRKAESTNLIIEDKPKHFIFKLGKTKLSILKLDNILEPRKIQDDLEPNIEISKAMLVGFLASSFEDVLGPSSQIRGFQLKASDKDVTLLATDGFRIYKASIQDDGLIKANETSAVFPVKVLKFMKQLDISDSPLNISISDSSYKIKTKLKDLELEIQGSTLVLEYPNIDSLLKSEIPYSYLIGTKKFKNELDLHNSICTNQIPVGIFDFKKSSLNIETDSKHTTSSVIEKGDYLEIIDHPDDIKINIRLKYLLEAIKYIEILDKTKDGKLEFGISKAPSVLVWVRPSEGIRAANPALSLSAILAPIAN